MTDLSNIHLGYISVNLSVALVLHSPARFVYFRLPIVNILGTKYNIMLESVSQWMIFFGHKCFCHEL